MKLDITRAWKDEAYRQSLSDEQLRMLPANPAGELELTETDLASVSGQFGPGGGFLGLGGGSDVHSFSIALCQNNVFSINTILATTPFLFGSIVPVCNNRS